jgi:hypothetical protein
MDGSDAGRLAEQVELFPLERLLGIENGVPVARNYRIEPESSSKPGAQSKFRPSLRGAEARLPGLTLVFDAQTGFNIPAEMRLLPAPGYAFEPPDDLLAVLGRAWRPLRSIKQGYKCNLGLTAKEPRHTSEAEAKLERTVRHLTRTLAAPPSQFHRRFARARWRVMARKASGALIVVGALVSGPMLLMIDLPNRSIWRFLAWNMPTVLMIGIFIFPDVPSLRIPARPRPLPDTAWTPSGLALPDEPADAPDSGADERSDAVAPERASVAAWLASRRRAKVAKETSHRRGLIGRMLSLTRRRA